MTGDYLGEEPFCDYVPAAWASKEAAGAST
jgi:hypothetical protein